MKLTMYDDNLPPSETSNQKNFMNPVHEIKPGKNVDDKNTLPIFYVKEDLIKQISKYDTLILLGETGCGKTTQIPQFILEHNINRSGQIIVSQPRRIAAVSIAKRVSVEMKEECGETAGYKIRFQNNISVKTKLIYATDGSLLREAMADQQLSKYNVVILDEAHERTITTDILFGVVQTAQQLRKIKNNPLKVIIMSAALDVDHFKKYFDDAPVFHIEGRRFKVNIFHTAENIDDYYFTCLTTVFNIHDEAPSNEYILVFLTGQEEIEKMAKEIMSISKSPECRGPPIQVNTLYASADPNTQLDVFVPAPQSTRKIVISTNIAETSVTIPGIKYVVDSGRVKMKFYNSLTGINVLKVQMISQEQALQRAGRAGRERDGICYRAYSTEQFKNMSKSTISEIKRSNLSAILLMLVAMRQNPMSFNFIDKPDEQEIKKSLIEIKELGALDNIENLTLTDTGKKMSALPLDPKYSKILLNAAEFNCVDEILDIIAMLSTDNIFITPLTLDSHVHEIRRKFCSSTGDHITLLNVYRQFSKVKLKHDWCKENYISFRALDFARHIKSQLLELCSKFRIHVSSCGLDQTGVRKCLITGLFKNVAMLQTDRSYSAVLSRQRCFIHPSSALHKSLPHCVLYTELMESSELYMKNITVIDTDWLHEYVPDFMKSKIFSLIENNSFS